MLSPSERSDLALDLLRKAVEAMLAGGVERLAVITLDERLACAGLDPRAEIIVQRTRWIECAPFTRVRPGRCLAEPTAC